MSVSRRVSVAAERLRVNWCTAVYSGFRVVDSTPSALADPTEVGSYFVATYPPFSAWSTEAVAVDGRPALESPPVPGVPLGLYLHIPFCRKRCHFCYFRVYTDKNAQEVGDYLDVLAHEWELYADAAVDRRPAAELRLLRWRDAVFPVHETARGSRRTPQRRDARGATRRK